MSEDRELDSREWEELKDADERATDSADANPLRLDEEGRDNLVFMIVTLIGLLFAGLVLGLYS